MPKTLVEQSQFDGSVQVGLGSELIRAATVESFVQKLLNRGRWLRDNAGILASDQEWTGLNAFTKAIALANTLFVTPANSVTAGVVIDNPVGPAEDWIEKISLQAGPGQRVRIYTGRHGSSLGAVAIVFNAIWNGTQWSLIESGQRATALIWRYADVRLVGKPASSPPWTSWPQNTLGAFGADLLVETMRSARTFHPPNTDADHQYGHRYHTETPVIRNSPIPLGTLWGNTTITSAGHIRRDNAVTGERDQIWIPIRIPPYSFFRAVRVRFYQLQVSQPDQFQLYRRTGNGPWEAQGSVETHNVFGSGDTVATLHGGGAETKMLEAHEWAYRWKVVTGDLAAVENRIVGVDLEWVDVVLGNRAG